MGNLSIDPLAIAALGGFVVLVGIGIGITIWFTKQAYKTPQPPKLPTSDD